MPRRKLNRNAINKASQENIFKQIKGICAGNFNIVTCINFLVMGIYYLIFVTGPRYIIQTYNSSLSAAGLTSGIMVIGCLAGRFMCGNIMELLGYRLLLAGGIFAYALSLLCTLATSTLAMIFLFRFLTGVSVGIIGTITATLVAHVAPANHKGFGISLFSMSTVLALALGPFAGLLLYRWFSHSTIISAMIAILFVSLLISLFLKNLPVISHHLRPIFKINSYIDPRVVKFSLVIFIVFLGYGCLQAFIPIFAEQNNLKTASSFFFLIYAIAALISRPFTGRQMDSNGEHRLVYGLLVLLAAAFTLLAFTSSSENLLIAAVCMGLGYGNLQSIGQIVAISLVTPSRFAQATSTFFIFQDLGIGFGPYIFGFVITNMGYQAMFITLGVIMLLALIPYYYLHARLNRFS